jgi:hypothetical protein
VEHAGCSTLEGLSQVLDEAVVFFDQRESDIGSLEKASQRAKSGSDFHDVIARLDIEEIHDFLGEILIV